MQEDIYRFSPDEFTAFVKKNSSFVLTTHVNPDGDALGSEIALAEWLQSIGKIVRVLNYSKTPENYVFLDAGNSLVEYYNEAKHKRVIESSDALLLLDTNDPERARSLEPYFSTHPNKALIDHHLYPKSFAQAEFIDTQATSTGEMVYRLITHAMKSLGGSISPKAALALYVAIMTDTGSFRFPRTDAEIFRISAELIDLGADPVIAYDRTYNAAKPSRVMLIGRCLSSLRFHHDARLAVQYILQKDLAECNATEEEVDGFVQFPLQVESVVFSVFVLEIEKGWKISFRSKGEYSAALFAQQYGGNGHFHAAGARVLDKTMPLDALASNLVSTTEKFLA